jgi:hypothetical protein
LRDLSIAVHTSYANKPLICIAISAQNIVNCRFLFCALEADVLYVACVDVRQVKQIEFEKLENFDASSSFVAAHIPRPLIYDHSYSYLFDVFQRYTADRIKRHVKL